MTKEDLKTDRGVQISDRRMYSVHRKRKEALTNKPTRFYSSRQEKAIAKAVGGKQVANSGATAFNKGDVTTNLFLLEAKTCTKEKESFSIKKEWFKKNEEEAFAMHKPYNALVFDYGDGVQHYIISESLFKYLQEKLEEEEK